MFNFFMAGSDRVCWEVTALNDNGPFRLAIHHGQGSIVEYFDDVAAALLRERQLEQLIIAARSDRRCLADPSWVTVKDGVH